MQVCDVTLDELVDLILVSDADAGSHFVIGWFEDPSATRRPSGVSRVIVTMGYRPESVPRYKDTQCVSELVHRVVEGNDRTCVLARPILTAGLW